MAKMQLGLSFLRPVVVSANEEAPNHPASNAALFTKWARTAQSTTAADGWTVTFDFGVSVTPPGFFLNNANFGLVRPAVSANGSSWTDLYAGSFTLVPTDDRLPPRRKAWFPSSAWQTTWNHRYFRIQAYSLDAGEPAFSLGAVAFPSPLVNMTRNWGNLDFTPREPVTRLAYPGGGGEANVEGRPLMAYDLSFGPNFKDALPQMHLLRALGQNMPFFFWENRGDLAHAYVLQRIAEVRFGETFATLTTGPWTLEECV